MAKGRRRLFARPGRPSTGTSPNFTFSSPTGNSSPNPNFKPQKRKSGNNWLKKSVDTLGSKEFATGIALAQQLFNTQGTPISETLLNYLGSAGYEMLKSANTNLKGKLSARKGDLPLRMKRYDVESGGGYALTSVPNPIAAEFNSNIKPNLYVSDYQKAEDNKCVPMHLSAAVFQIPATAGMILNDYFKQIIAFDVQSKAQANVSFNLNISSDFTTDKILLAINSTIWALQVYFSYNSILSYHANPSNRNEAVIALRNNIGANEIESLSKLARRLMDTPVPPNLYKLIRFMSGIYSTGTIPGAPLIKIVPWNLDSSTGLDLTVIDTAYAQLCNTEYDEIFSLLRRAVPHWIPQTLEDLPTVPVYSENFSTVFANLPAMSTTGGATPTITTNINVSNDTTDISYCSYSNYLDGAMYSLCSIYNTTTQRHEPGFMYPVLKSISSAGSTRRSYSSNSAGNHSFRYPKDDYDIIASRPETVADVYNLSSVYGYSAVNVHLPATNKCKGVNINSITETTYKVLDYLMSLDQIRPNFTNAIKGKPGNTKF